jgi:ankyrin repeat protein
VSLLILEAGADGNAQGGQYGNALQAASAGGHDQVVQRLLEAGADINAKGGRYGNALRAASYEGHDQVVQRLLEAGADGNAQGGGLFSNALQVTSYMDHD